MNMVMSISIRNMMAVPTNIADVPSITAAANLSVQEKRMVVCADTSISHLSITPMITSAGMNEKRLSRKKLYSPETSLESITSHKYRGGLSEYGSP